MSVTAIWGIFVWFPKREDTMEENRGGGEEAENHEVKAEEISELAQVWRFHEIFCEQLKSLAAGIEESEVGKWEIRESSTEVVMLVEAGWKEKGVRLTWKEDPMVRYVGFAAEELRIVEEEARGGFWELRCPLERAIRIVASRDPERRGGRREEWNEQYQEMLVDDEDSGRDDRNEAE
ncbi:MAG: hypothetical protein Q9208_000815 [Pyrenodesmia sp. 3 TL-2023]